MSSLKKIFKHTPMVSVLTPTYNRAHVLPWVIKRFKQQNYPLNRMELVVIDDSDAYTDSQEHVFKEAKIQYRYIRLKDKVPLGQKRNMMNEAATGDILVCWDDDDLYPMDRVKHAVEVLNKSELPIAAPTDMVHVYFSHDNTIRQFDQKLPTNNQFAYRKEYAKTHFYTDNKNLAEEVEFTNRYTQPFVSLNAHRTLLCVSHDNNTYDKKQMLHQFKMTPYKLENFFSYNRNDPFPRQFIEANFKQEHK